MYARYHLLHPARSQPSSKQLSSVLVVGRYETRHRDSGWGEHTSGQVFAIAVQLVLDIRQKNFEICLVQLEQLGGRLLHLG